MAPAAAAAGRNGSVLRIVAFSAVCLGALACLLLWPSRLDPDAHEHAIGGGRPARRVTDERHADPRRAEQPAVPRRAKAQSANLQLSRQLQAAQPTPAPPPPPTPAPTTPSPPEPTSPPVECVDTHSDHSQCVMWAGNNECVRNPNGMLTICKKSCNACTPEGEKRVRDAAQRELDRLAALAEASRAWREGGDKNGQRLWPPARTPEQEAEHQRQQAAAGTFDWYGLKIPNTPAASRVPPLSVRADYNITAVDPAIAPAAYDYGENPAFRYPERNDRLFITLATTPRVLFFPNFLTDEECDTVVQNANKSLSRSQVAITPDGAKRGESAVQEIRSSRSGYVTFGKHNGLDKVNERMTAIAGTLNHEPVGVLNYQPGQHYEAHNDYFDPTMYGEGQTSNRFLTIFLYVNDVAEGGATTIPRANGGPYPKEFRVSACQMGLQVLPRKGSAIAFYDMRPDRSLDPFSLHGGCDVIRGEKWAGPVWFRARTPPGTGHSHE
eukprot:TRINITY_DN3575_c0_g1_i1.p1 TRINITY_DN3575_c0_g1~~TRINITY_DN3575_c0_g1_i1.p1  ORF type:complete len:527 (+),score=97.33 TRINITY_DN3575_c0_g1_i1:94-1581(+)